MVELFEDSFHFKEPLIDKLFNALLETKIFKILEKNIQNSNDSIKPYVYLLPWYIILKNNEKIFNRASLLVKNYLTHYLLDISIDFGEKL